MEISIISLENRKGAQLGEATKVRRGYARYLISQNKALPYNETHKAEFVQMRATLEKQEAEKVEAAQIKATQLKDLSIELTRRAADATRLYGSIGPKEIADAITALGVSITKKDVHLNRGPIRSLGEHEISICLHEQVIVPVTIRVTAQSS